MDFAQFGAWLAGGVAIVGILQWIKGLAPKTWPAWLYAIAVPVLAAGWSVAPPWAQQAAGVLAISQIGYETIIQTVKRKLGGTP